MINYGTIDNKVIGGGVRSSTDSTIDLPFIKK